MPDSQINKDKMCLHGSRHADIVVSIGLLALFAVVMYWRVMSGQWTYDAIIYSYVIPENLDDMAHTVRHIETIGDVFESQVHHYFMSEREYFTNGRFPVHFMVQFFCGMFESRVPYAICNTIVWLGVLLLFLSFLKISLSSWKGVLLTCIILPIAYDMPFDPPFQINYVWVTLSTLIWFKLYFGEYEKQIGSKWRSLYFVGILGYSIFAGWGNESISFAVGIGVLALFIRKRFRCSAKEWTMASGYAIGCVLLLLSPGLYSRYGVVSAFSPRQLIMEISMNLGLLLMWLVTWILAKRRNNLTWRGFYREHFFLFWIFIASLLEGFVLYKSFERVILPAYLCSIFWTISFFRQVQLPRWWKGLVICVCLITFCVNSRDEIVAGRYISYVGEKARQVAPSDSLIYMSMNDPQDKRYFSRLTTFMFNWERFDKHPGAHKLISMAPDTLKTIPFECDTNALIHIDERRWFIVQSHNHPARFVVDREVDFGPLHYVLTPRYLVPEYGSDIYMFDTPKWRVAMYCSNPFIKADVRMIPQKGGEDE